MPWCTTCNLAKSAAPGFNLVAVAHVDLSGRKPSGGLWSGSRYYAHKRCT